MKFKTFTNGDIGISGVVPEGWIEKSPGEFLRGASDTDRTLLVQQGVPGLTIDEVKPELLPHLGIEEFPKSVGGIKTANSPRILPNTTKTLNTGRTSTIPLDLITPSISKHPWRSSRIMVSSPPSLHSTSSLISPERVQGVD